MSVRVAVVDDEDLGRRGILARLAGREDVEVVAECANGAEAVAAIRSLAPDLVFLDVQMPGMDGFGVLAELGEEERPHVVFVTAHDRHALRAFEVHALDYLLKPIEDDRFEAALERAIASLRGARDAELGRRVSALLGSAAPRAARPAERYPVRLKGRIVLLKHAEIEWVAAEGDYVRLHAGGRSFLSRDTMAAVEHALSPRRFLRVHRSTLVNLDHVREIRLDEDGDASVVLRDGTALRVGRSYRAAVDRLAGG